MTDLPFPTSLPDFQRLFPDDAACAAYLEKIRWPEGFVCPYDGWTGEPYRFENRPGVLRCRECQRNIALTAGTVMEKTHSPLSTWFWGAYLMSSMTPGMSAVQFQRQLGLKRYETAFQILHKLRAGMIRPDRDQIGKPHPVEVDEVWIGGRTRGEGRGVHHKTLVVGAVEVRTRVPKEPHPFDDPQSKALPRRGGRYAGRLRLQVVPDRSAKSLVGFVVDSVLPGTHVTTDDWSGYDKLADKGYLHTEVAERGDPKVAEEYLPLTHLVFSNLKTWLLGAHHGVSPQHLQAYLNEFTFRFNRRFYPFNAFRSLLGIGAGAEAATYAELYSGEWRHPNPTEPAWPIRHVG
jgi:transposase-like protein